MKYASMSRHHTRGRISATNGRKYAMKYATISDYAAIDGLLLTPEE